MSQGLGTGLTVGGTVAGAALTGPTPKATKKPNQNVVGSSLEYPDY